MRLNVHYTYLYMLSKKISLTMRNGLIIKYTNYVGI